MIIEYSMHIDGRLSGAPNSNTSQKAYVDFQKGMGTTPTGHYQDRRTGWPDGYIFPGGEPALWKTSIYPGGTTEAPQTKIDFWAKVIVHLPGSVAQSRETILKITDYTCDYPKMLWYEDLDRILNNLNSNYAKEIIDRFQIRNRDLAFSDGSNM